MLEKVENYIRQWKMLEKGDKVVVGLSGGADSVCLFLILEELRKKIGFEILAVHVNHGIRGEEAKADEEFVKTLCEKKEIPCRSVSVDIPKMAVEYRMSEEEAGRTARREIFEQAAEEWGGTRIALAHHQDDNAETFFLHLFVLLSFLVSYHSRRYDLSQICCTFASAKQPKVKLLKKCHFLAGKWDVYTAASLRGEKRDRGLSERTGDALLH